MKADMSVHKVSCVSSRISGTVIVAGRLAFQTRGLYARVALTALSATQRRSLLDSVTQDCFNLCNSSLLHLLCGRDWNGFIRFLNRPLVLVIDGALADGTR
jgi:hypothetical protein